ncbi:unnamed protein product [Staurois parvus]|uniref:Uncharacterized protein n=1 Tax=Staurois parvus TaxID=386267 RepID=A0ABN9GCG6_9NEOB|nr:unnamed protein product [Staurois parvus]
MMTIIGTYQRDVPVLCIPGIPHRKVTPSLTITKLMDPVMGTHQRDVPILCIPGFHTGRSHHPSPSSEWNPRDDNIDVKEEYKEEDEEYAVMEEFFRRTQGYDGATKYQEPTREMSPSSVFPGFHTGSSHHPSLLQEWRSNRYRI